ncbi:MAG: prolyl oligopeptidase family serine peptidase [Planctomycetaceae bacterium]|nr:prolyl oligopeptidase family serine peptidase [Planctomycetales bacterium]MCB9936733.1 prolyl oligopeptidase family serine peptidase [Planctomycetaceae bacterium]
MPLLRFERRRVLISLLGLWVLCNVVAYGIIVYNECLDTQIAVYVANHSDRGDDYGDLISLPAGYATTGRKWPVLLFLHGAGQRGNDLQAVKEHGIPRLLKEGQEFPFIVVSPQTQRSGWKSEPLLRLLDQIEERYNVDSSRIYATGLSMGGYGVWRLAAAAPDRFAEIAPMCGGGAPSSAESMKSLPVWVFHGAKDDVVPLSESEEIVAALNAVGANIRFTIYPDADHNCWDRTYAAPELYSWMLQYSNAMVTNSAQHERRLHTRRETR